MQVVGGEPLRATPNWDRELVVNFFGHAVMAALEDAAPRFLLGAMLPDLSTMAGARIERVSDGAIARGVEHHHRIDHAFHACAPFIALCSSALATSGEARSESVVRASTAGSSFASASALISSSCRAPWL